MSAKTEERVCEVLDESLVSTSLSLSLSDSDEDESDDEESDDEEEEDDDDDDESSSLSLFTAFFGTGAPPKKGKSLAVKVTLGGRTWDLKDWRIS